MSGVRRDKLVVVGVGLLALLIYAYSQPPDTHFGGDCGEMACGAACLGIGHPTGYPLYQMLGKLATLLVPFGTISWRVCLVSSVGAALAVALATWLVAALTGDRVAAAAAGLVLIFDNTFFSQAVICEVYGLHVAFLLLLFLGLTRYGSTRDRRWLNVAGLAVGLGAVHHVSMAFNAPAAAAYLWVTEARRARPGAALGAALAALARMAVWALAVVPIYVYLPIRANLEPAMSWGHTQTWSGFRDHITGRMYATTLLDVGPQEALRYAYNHIYLILHDQQWGAILGLLGLVVALRRWTAEAILLVGVFATSIYFASHYRVGDRANYALPAHLATALAAGLGAAWLRGQAARRQQAPGRRERYGRRLDQLLATVLLLMPLLPGPPQGIPPLRRCLDYSVMHGKAYGARQADAVLDDLPHGAVLLSSLDELTNAIWYRQLVDGKRRDVTLLQFTHIERPEEQQKAIGWINYYLAQKRVFSAWYEPWMSRHYDFVDHAATVEVFGRGRAPVSPLGVAPVAKTVALPGCQTWRLASARVEGAVQLPTDGPDTVVGLRARLLARVRAQLVNQAAPRGDEEVVLLLVQRDLEAYLNGKRSTPPTSLNDSSVPITWAWYAAWPLACDPPASADTRGLSTVVSVPIWVPDVTGGGDYQVRLGILPRGEARRLGADREPTRLRERTEQVGWARLFWR